MSRKILAITGSRAEYGAMRPVFRKIVASENLQLELAVTGMHLAPQFVSSLDEIRADRFGPLHHASILLAEDSGNAMAQSLGIGIMALSPIVAAICPDILLVQGDRGEMLAGAIAAAHQNIPIVHMSGGDQTGSIDDSIRHAITRFAHVHLTTCAQSTNKLLAMGEAENRIFEVGEPTLDQIKEMDFISPQALADEFGLDLAQPLLLATQHPVTTESKLAARQMEQTIKALTDLGLQTIFTYPNTDAGGREMARVLEAHRDQTFLRLIPHLGSHKYLSLMRIASVLLGNSSSGILEACSFGLPVINIGTRQYGRMRAGNVIDVGHDSQAIRDAIKFVMEDRNFREHLKECRNPYGDGNTASKTVDILTRLRLVPSLLAKWIETDERFLA